MLEFSPNQTQKRNWESLAWLEIQTAFDWLADRVPGLARVQIPINSVHAVSPIHTGQYPVVLKWSMVEPGVCDSIKIPYSLVRQGVARRQVCWLTAGFLHAGYRYGLRGQKEWKKISRAGGVAGVLFPGFARALSLHRLESQALIILAAGSRLAWARLRIPQVRYAGLNIRHRDIEEAGWLKNMQDTARLQAKQQTLHGDEWMVLVLDSMALECHTLMNLLSDSSERKEILTFMRLERGLLSLIAAIEGRKKVQHLKEPLGVLDKMIQSMVVHRKINNADLTTLLGEVEKLQVMHIHYR